MWVEASYSLVWPKGRVVSRPLGMLVEWLGRNDSEIDPRSNFTNAL